MTPKTILCTFPGRHGDLLWALPTIRAISETFQTRVALLLSAKYYPALEPLLRDQPYLDGVMCAADWQVQETAPISPRLPPSIPAPGEWDRVFHLGYEGWPTPNLPQDIYDRANRQFEAGGMLRGLDLSRPWITPPTYAKQLAAPDLAVGFTDEHFELKYGLYMLLYRRWATFADHTRSITNVSGASSRWQREAGAYGPDFAGAAAWISRSRVFLGCCSALHVLAVGLGVPVVVMEPNEQRHNPIFWPLGTKGPAVQQVIGGDGAWTWDARHVAETIEAQWAGALADADRRRA